MGRKSTLTPGEVINRTYEAVRLLGSGYSGEVWEVKHLHLPASYALKIMHAEDRDDAHKSSRFRAEGGVLFGLRHENIVRIWDANETPEGLFYLVMELLAGETLTERMAKGRIHPLRALKYAYDLACGLDAAHEIGVVHRDVKPDNVFITFEDVVKILDFTAAKFFHVLLRTTEPSARVGTLAFMSAEHIEGETTDARIDQYSLALVLYTMLRGKHPFERYFSSQYKLMQAQALEMPERLAKVAGLPSWLDEMLAPALAKKIEQRYATMAEFMRAIHGALRRLAREMREGELTFAVPLGEPAIDVEGSSAAREVQRVYLAPGEPARQTTAPLPPTERVSVAPDALPDAHAKDTATFDTAATAPLPVSRHAATEPVRRAATTAAVGPMTTAVPLRPSRSRAFLAPLGLLLVLPAVAGVGWRWKARQAAASPVVEASPIVVVAVPAALEAPSQAAEPPAPHDDVVLAPMQVPAPTVPQAPARLVAATRREPVPSTAPLSPPPTPKPAGSAARANAGPILDDAWADAPAPSPAPTTTPQPPAAPPATAASHRLFGTEN